MSNVLKFSSLLLALAAVLALTGITQADEGQPEISLAEVNLGTHVNGPEVTAEALSGKVVAFEYWGDRCGPCIRAIPHTSAVQAEYGRDKLIVVANQVWTQDVDAAKAAWKKAGGNDEVSVVNHGGLKGAVVRGVPHAFVFDHTGKLLWRGHPADPKFDETIKNAVAALPAPAQN